MISSTAAPAATTSGSSTRGDVVAGETYDGGTDPYGAVATLDQVIFDFAGDLDISNLVFVDVEVISLFSHGTRCL